MSWIIMRSIEYNIVVDAPIKIVINKNEKVKFCRDFKTKNNSETTEMANMNDFIMKFPKTYDR